MASAQSTWDCPKCGDNVVRRLYGQHTRSCGGATAGRAGKRSRATTGEGSGGGAHDEGLGAPLEWGDDYGGEDDPPVSAVNVECPEDFADAVVASDAAHALPSACAPRGGHRKSLAAVASEQYTTLRVAALQSKLGLSESAVDAVIALMQDPHIDPRALSDAKAVGRCLASAMAADGPSGSASPFDGADCIALPRTDGCPARVPEFVEVYAFSVKAQIRSLLCDPTLVHWNRLTHAEDMNTPEAPLFAGGARVDYGCPSLSGQARADFACFPPPAPGVIVLPIAIGVQFDGGQLARKSHAMGYPLVMIPFFLKLPYRLHRSALKKLALLPAHFGTSEDSAAEHDALAALFQNALWHAALKEIQDSHGEGGFDVDGIAGAPTGARIRARIIFSGMCADGPALETLLALVKLRCPICLAPAGRKPYFAAGAGPPRRTEEVVRAARVAAAAAHSVSGARKALNGCGIHRTESSFSRLTLAGGIWEGSNSCDRVVCDALLHNTYLGEVPQYIKGVEAVLTAHSADDSASPTIARLIASNTHYSAGNRRWVSLRNMRRAGGTGIPKWNGFMRRSQLAMTVAALRGVALDLGDDGERQVIILAVGEDILEKTGLLEAEKGCDADLLRLAALQAAVAAGSETCFAPVGLSFETHTVTHTSFHVPELVRRLGAVVHWNTALGVETAMPQLKSDFEHCTGVWSADKTLAVRSDQRSFVEQVINPALAIAAAGFVAAAQGLGGAAGAPAEEAVRRDGDDDLSSGSDASTDSPESIQPRHQRVTPPYSRFPDAPPAAAHCTGELWAGMSCIETSTGRARVGARLLQALQTAYDVLRTCGSCAAALPRYSLDKVYWRRAIFRSLPPSLGSEGCKRRLAVVPSGARDIFRRDAKLYASRQPCFQLFKPQAPGSSGDPVPDDDAMVRVEALVSVDVRVPTIAARLSRDRIGATVARAGLELESADFALVTLLPRVSAMDSANFKGFSNAAPSLSGEEPSLGAEELACSRLVPVAELCRPRWAFAAFGQRDLPAGKGEVGPWAGSLVSVLMMPGS